MRSGLKAKLTALSLLAGASFGMSNAAHAVAVSCPGLAWSTLLDRQFVLAADAPAAPATCTDFGNNQFDDASYVASGWSLIDRTGDSDGSLDQALSATGVGTNSGEFSVSGAVWSAYSNVLFVLQGGGPGFLGLFSTPDWAAFTLSDGTASGDWYVSTDEVSKISLYGRSDAARAVPEPGMLALFGMGLLGVGLTRRREPPRPSRAIVA
jgi:hypothetical protein